MCVCPCALARGQSEVGADTGKVRTSCEPSGFISMYFYLKFPMAVPSSSVANSSTNHRCPQFCVVISILSSRTFSHANTEKSFCQASGPSCNLETQQRSLFSVLLKASGQFWGGGWVNMCISSCFIWTGSFLCSRGVISLAVVMASCSQHHPTDLEIGSRLKSGWRPMCKHDIASPGAFHHSGNDASPSIVMTALFVLVQISICHCSH